MQAWRLPVPLLWSFLSIARGVNPDFAQDIGSLKVLQGTPGRPIEFWAGRPAVMMETKEGRPKYFRITEDLTAELIAVPGLDEVTSLGGSTASPLAAGKAGGRNLLRQKTGGEWKSLPLPESVKVPQIIPANGGPALLDGMTLLRYDGGKWSATSLPAVPRFYREFKPVGCGGKQYLYGTQLLAGWDAGEWGGMLAMYDLSKPKSGWKEVSGGKVGDDSRVPGNVGVTGMTTDSSGKLWTCEGSCHMGGMWRGLYRYDGKKWDAIVHGSFAKSEGGKISIPGESTDVLDVFCADDGKLYVLAGQLGIFVYEEGALKPVVSIDFYDDIVRSAKEGAGKKAIEVSIPCYPVGLVADAAGRLYVSTDSYGILCFIKEEGKYRMKQVILPGMK